MKADVVVVGSGLAGLACASAIRGRKVVLITKTDSLPGGSSLWAQGGIAAAVGPGDHPVDHARDTIAAGGGLCDAGAVGRLTARAPAAVAAMLDLGVPFDRDARGGLVLGREGAHSRARIAHADGDRTGRAVVLALCARLARAELTVLTGTFVSELVTADGRIRGVRGHRDGVGAIAVAAPCVVLATGGLGALWADTTNPSEASGDGLALALRAGARAVDLEFMQFHPTALANGDGERLPLLTEALRGAGARLLRRDGTPLLAGRHPQGDLAPRDVVARAIRDEQAAGRPVLLDLRPALTAKGDAAFPQAIESCRAAGFNPHDGPVPITPAAHYHMGGVLVDAAGCTTVPGLWACGEVAGTGVHGANRLASNSLLEAFVAGTQAAEALSREAAEPVAELAPTAAGSVPGAAAVAPLRARLRRTMSLHFGIMRDAAGMAAGEAAIGALAGAFHALPAAASPAQADIRAAGEFANLLLVARLLAAAAKRRTESRGGHARSDFPQARPEWIRRQLASLSPGGDLLRDQDIAPASLAAE